ncbi:MAG TPA: hypothetical protein VH813_06340 [Candidatus Limnocylindrales bacterium]
MYFYELHEGDNEVYSDVLLVHDSLFPPEEFFELVQSIRRRIQDSFEDDTLIEAIAVELERDHGFTFVSDARLSASVNVSVDEDDNFLSTLDSERDEDADFRTLYADFDGRPN